MYGTRTATVAAATYYSYRPIVRYQRLFLWSAFLGWSSLADLMNNIAEIYLSNLICRILRARKILSGSLAVTQKERSPEEMVIQVHIFLHYICTANITSQQFFFQFV